ncbi:lambda-crystallin homolog [Salmo salar]|uniref:Lambda-crystallin homolog n=1 Tax=Salmo salar TaxID=8030 RepID=A0ABM3DPX0_SALSA|nr:lambda-crystallin homolog [Salmo salar]
MSSSEAKTITVIGSGLIGRSWAMVFMSGGYRVKIYDNQAARAFQEVRSVLENKAKHLEELQEAHILSGQLSASEQLALLSSHDLPQALAGTFFIQVNPPYYLRLVELVPHPETLPGVMDTTHALMTAVGQAPVRLKKEIDGFALNRVQYAIIAESWRLLENGVISVKDIDLVMSEGLGMRYAFIGPMETMHLNAPEVLLCQSIAIFSSDELTSAWIRSSHCLKVWPTLYVWSTLPGLEDYLQRYREGMRRVLNAFGPVPEFSGEAAECINKVGLSEPQHLSARRERRDQLLMGLAKLKK